MILVLDSNEYINHINKKASLDNVFVNESFEIFLNELILREVLRNIRNLQAKEFYNIIFSKNINFLT